MKMKTEKLKTTHTPPYFCMQYLYLIRPLPVTGKSISMEIALRVKAGI